MNSKAKTISFIAVEFILFVLFMAIDLNFFDNNLSEATVPSFFVVFGMRDLSSIIKYGSILICAVYAFRNAPQLLAGALMFTAFSDYFLLFTSFYLPGVISFCIAQTLYLALIAAVTTHYGDNSVNSVCSLNLKAFSDSPKADELSRFTFMHFTIRAAVAVVLFFVLHNPAGKSALFAGFVSFYAASFVGNIVLAFKLPNSKEKKQPLSKALFCTGLCLFMLCDLNVLLFNLPYYLTINSPQLLRLTELAGNAMWLFYLPSQVILVLSAQPRPRRQQES